MSWPDYAELHCLSAFSFQRGASIAKELFHRAAHVGYTALAITDECSLAGIVRAHEAAKELGVRLIVGSEIQLADGPKLVLLVADHDGYTALCRLITVGRRGADKGSYRLTRADLSGLCEASEGLLALWVPGKVPDEEHGRWVSQVFPQRCWLAVELHRSTDDEGRCSRLRALADKLGMRAVAAGDVHYHVRQRRALHDVMTAIRHRTTVAKAGAFRFPNGERHLRSRRALAAIYPAELLAEAVRVAERCRFSLTELRYTYPKELVPDGHTPTSWLRQLTEEGVRWRWPEGASEKARALIEKELALIADLKYESYFLTVQDIVRFARGKGILCQGRGSAANSAVCFALGITEIAPDLIGMLFERFISKERNEPPDIDIDFEHERREEVLQYVFQRYGRDRAALTCIATSYRGRSAVRDVAKALGLAPDQVNALASTLDSWSTEAPVDGFLVEAGFDPNAPIVKRVVAMTTELMMFPRHLSQHPGGFVISEYPLSTLVPVENAAMDDRTVIQWDKDDLDTLGLLKVDCLALGMLTAVRKTLEMLKREGRHDLTLATVPAEDPATYEMIGRADTLGVFQIESRAQMSMLPRLKPKCFYDLVIEVAIVRPGPIQGDMVHPYLRRRQGLEPVDYPPALKAIFERTLGVPLFQEQVMQIAIDAAGYSPGDADQLRRSMAAWKRRGGLEPHRERLTQGMLARGYSAEFAEKLFHQIQGFGSYGFPESHAASFALITYASCWLKCHEPAAFAASLINSQPLGFYTPDQILQDARRHGIEVLPVDVRYSEWDCTLEADPRGRANGHTGAGGWPAIRLGLRLISGFVEAVATAIVGARCKAAFADVEDLCRRVDLDHRHRDLLADAGALRGLAGHRHRARWAVQGVEAQRPLFEDVAPTAEVRVVLPPPNVAEDMRTDYATTGTTLGPHPLKLLRGRLQARHCRSSTDLARLPHGTLVRYAGLVRLRQRPETASGVVFMTLEDEAGMVNAIVWRDLADRQRRVMVESQLMCIHGKVERKDGVQHLIAQRLENWNGLLEGMRAPSRDFR
ncbi:MAG: error-prone DNA polymerase [Lysobacterales bacterium 69-70]|nr:error-prone DNA polymerase [Xanthomonadaceae bacterium]ODU35775.1 MAG: error-prone DNA polymerase [Xanthomonadaceae bacterium SCN 69-320]ODV17487.1 MAG: error-prone DNA polymerase [Xanthomonadaceae bacterium SCN 69-25]OJY97263.1 MAG: error-prone DNA polymerase [Xanthomonadales bacterium 69-70]